MARPKIYKDEQEAYRAKLDSNARYIEQNLIKIQVRLPKEYGPKLENISKELNTSKAQVLKMLIDAKYNELFGDEPQQSSPEESDT